MKVQNMISPRSGRPVANQFLVYTNNNTVYFQSYDSVIAVKQGNGKVVLDEHYWDYSRTTGVYRNQFLGENIARTREKIDSGEYILTNLNP